MHLFYSGVKHAFFTVHVWISINLHACNISDVAMIATVNTTAITITLAIAI